MKVDYSTCDLVTLCVVIVINDLLVHSFRDQDLQVIVNQNGLKILKFHFSLHAYGSIKWKRQQGENGEHP